MLIYLQNSLKIHVEFSIKRKTPDLINDEFDVPKRLDAAQREAYKGHGYIDL